MRSFMKIASLVLALLLCCSCAAEPTTEQEQEITPEPESDWQNQSQAEEAPAVNEDFYPMEIEEQSNYSQGFTRTNCIWNGDGTLSFQNRETLVTLSAENEIIDVLELSQKPNSVCDSVFSVSDSYIIAAHRDPEFDYDGVVYYTYGGEVRFANMTLYDREGNFIREYPAAPIQDDDGNYTLPVNSGDYVMFHNRITDGSGIFYWLDDTKAFVRITFRVVLYDFETDTCTTVWTEKMARDFCPAPEFELADCIGPFDGKLYLTVYEEYGPNDWNGSVWSLDEKGFARLFEGNIIDSNGEIMAIHREDGMYCWNFVDEEPAKVIDFPEDTYLYNRSIHLDGTRFDFQLNLETVFHSYFADTGELRSYDLGATVRAVLYGAKEENGVLKYYFNSAEERNDVGYDCLWVYDSETGFSKRLIEHPKNRDSMMTVTSPDLSLLAQIDDNIQHASIRVVKIEDK